MPAPRGGPATRSTFLYPSPGYECRISRAPTLHPTLRLLSSVHRLARPLAGPSLRPARRADLLSRSFPTASSRSPAVLVAVLVARVTHLGEAAASLRLRAAGAPLYGASDQEEPHRLAPPLAGARSSLPSAYSIRRSFSSLRLRGASVPCAPVRPQARKFALRHAAQALSTRALIGHVRQAGSPERKKRHRGRAREPRKRTREGTICFKYISKKEGKESCFFFFHQTERNSRDGRKGAGGRGGLLNAARDVVDTVMLKARARACSARESKRIILPASSAPML